MDSCKYICIALRFIFLLIIRVNILSLWFKVHLRNITFAAVCKFYVYNFEH